MPNADQLRTTIDSGAAGDKIAFPDPAAAPLGTDAEAGGNSPSASERREAFTAEVTAVPPPSQTRQNGALLVVLGFLALILVSAILTAMIFAEG